jgi:hypothetical protein
LGRLTENLPIGNISPGFSPQNFRRAWDGLQKIYRLVIFRLDFHLKTFVGLGTAYRKFTDWSFSPENFEQAAY